jgi:hypothetical protein
MQERKVNLFPTPVLAGIGALVIAGASFFGGMVYQKAKQPTAVSTMSSSQANSGSGGRRFGGQRPAVGTVASVSSSSLTITVNDGTSKQFNITSSTTVTNSGQPASISDIATGDTVFVVASASKSSDAARIALNPSSGGGFGGGANTTAPNSVQSN